MQQDFARIQHGDDAVATRLPQKAAQALSTPVGGAGGAFAMRGCDRNEALSLYCGRRPYLVVGSTVDEVEGGLASRGIDAFRLKRVLAA